MKHTHTHDFFMVTRKPTGAYTQCSDRHLLLSDSFTNETSETGAHSCGILFLQQQMFSPVCIYKGREREIREPLPGL